MEQEYKVGLFGKIFYGLLAGGALVFFSFLLISKPQNSALIYLIFLIPALFCLAVLINLFKSRVIITDTSITRERLFYNKTLNFTEIKGVRVSSRLIVIEPVDASLGNLRISNYDYLTNDDDLVRYINTKFTNLNKQDIEKEKELFLQDEALGRTEQEREAKMDKIRQIGIAYIVWGFIMCFTLIFVRSDYASLLVGMLYPVVGIILMKLSFGLIKFIGNSQKSHRLGIAVGLCMPVGLVFITAVVNYNLSALSSAIYIAVVLGIALFVLLFNVGVNNACGNVVAQGVFMLIMSVLYSVGSTIIINCLFDSSTPVTFRTMVGDEYTTTGKGPHYHLRLNPWKPGQDVTWIDVSRKEYEQSPIGSPVTIGEKKGLFNIPWFTYTLDPPPMAPVGSNNENFPIPK
jgi:hypothetical protein